MTMINENERQWNDLYGNEGNMFRIFDNTGDNMALPPDNLDPDLKFHQDYVPTLNLNFRYWTENNFNSAYDQMNRKKVTNVVSLCHVNIRSVAKVLSILSISLQAPTMTLHSSVSQKRGSKMAIMTYIL